MPSTAPEVVQEDERNSARNGVPAGQHRYLDAVAAVTAAVAALVPPDRRKIHRVHALSIIAASSLTDSLSGRAAARMRSNRTARSETSAIFSTRVPCPPAPSMYATSGATPAKDR